MLMKWFFWNVRGMNKRYKQKKIKLLLKNKVNLAGLVETRVKSKFLEEYHQGGRLYTTMKIVLIVGYG